jgi:hypothetical protein
VAFYSVFQTVFVQQHKLGKNSFFLYSLQIIMDCNSIIRYYIFWINDSVNERSHRNSHVSCKLLILTSTIVHNLYGQKLSITFMFRHTLSYSFIATCFGELNTTRKLKIRTKLRNALLYTTFYPKKSCDWPSQSLHADKLHAVYLHVVYLHHTGMFHCKMSHCM